VTTSTRAPGHDEDNKSHTDRTSYASRGARLDLWAVAAAALLLTVAAVVGRSYEDSRETLRLRWPPLSAFWVPHWGSGSFVAPAVAVLVVIYGPALARSLPWRTLVLAGWPCAMAWSWSLALIDGWRGGVAMRLTSKYEYLQSVGEIDDIGATLREFTSRIVMTAPDNWPPHVAGHPPAALLTFVGLDRIGLSGGAWAAAFVITVGSSAAAAVLVTVRALASEETARKAAPYVVLAPATLWMGVSADGYFAAVSAWALALLALSATRSVRAPRTVALCSGLLFGLTCYLSYGLVLIGIIALAVLIAARAVRPVPYVLLGMAPWFVVFTAAGFWWFEGYSALVERYYQGAAAVRPYGYFVWANLAAQTAVIGPACIAALRRVFAVCTDAARAYAARTGAQHPPNAQHPPDAPSADITRQRQALILLVAAGLCCVLTADLSGMSKGETERIWLPFTLWLLPATALLPARSMRWWLSAQAVVTLTVNHLLFTGW
jgi:methylthioxylose transferase